MSLDNTRLDYYIIEDNWIKKNMATSKEWERIVKQLINEGYRALKRAQYKLRIDLMEV